MLSDTQSTTNDKIKLKILLVNGNSHIFDFSKETSAQDISEYVYSHWPEDWDAEPSKNYFRLIYRGRFLHGSVTLGALNLPPEVTVMHLLERETLPDPGKKGQKKKPKTEDEGCCCLLS